MYITLEGDQNDGFLQLKKEGGQLFPAKYETGSTTHVRGSRVTTYWGKNSPIRRNVMALAREWNLEPEHQTYGRLAKWYIKNILDLKYKNTYWHNQFRAMAKDGFHWHYLHWVPGDHGYCFEWDIKAAYLTSILQGKSLFYDGYKGYVEDFGALETLRGSLDLLPKEFRLILIGILASHQYRYWINDKKQDSEGVPARVEKNWIEYNACFNAVHGGIYRLWLLMRKLHEIGGDYIVRCHTDSLLIKEDIPPDRLQKIADLICSKGHQITIKAEGRAVLFDLDCGFIGNKPLGGIKLLADRMREQNITLYDQKLKVEVELQWQKYKTGGAIDLSYQP